MIGILLMVAADAVQFKKGDPMPDISPVVMLPSELVDLGTTADALPKKLKVVFQPKLLSPGRELLVSDDYPAPAMRNLEQGTSNLVFTVGADGRVTNCAASGATKTLDEAACRIVTRRARFDTAMSSDGEHLTVEAKGSVVWKISQAFLDWQDAQNPYTIYEPWTPLRRKPFFARLLGGVFGTHHN